MAFAFIVSCGKQTESQTTSSFPAPENLSVDENGVVTWDKVANAVMYYVYYGDEREFVTTESFKLPDANKKWTVSVQAVVKTSNGTFDTEKSASIEYEPYVAPFNPSVVQVAITCDVKTIKSGATESGKNTAKFKATVNNAQEGADTSVEWKIVSGKELVESTSTRGNEFTVVAADDVSGDNDVIVEATSVTYPSAKARKAVEVVAKPMLTQAMLDSVSVSDKLGFEGYVSIDVYERATSGRGKLYTTQTLTIKTSMSGDKDENPKTRNTWSAEYVNSNGIAQQLYCRKDSAGNACEIGVSLMNEEELYPMKDDDGLTLSWEDAGLYNNFKGLSVSDFYLDNDSWRYTYDTSKNGFDKVKKMVASANPYDFDATKFELIIDGDEIIGISAESEDSLSVVEGYVSAQTLRAAFNADDTVEVKTISKFKTLEEYKNDVESEASQTRYKELSILDEAVKNMRSLKSYTVKFTNEQISNLGVQSNKKTGYDETVTENYRYFVPCDVVVENNRLVRNPQKYGMYGYKKLNGRTDIYNAFYDVRNKDTASDSLSFTPTRAFTDGFDSSKPSFEFSPEIFTGVIHTDSEGYDEYYFFVDTTMCRVATTFYKGLGNDDQLFGLFASVARDTSGNTISPYVVVKRGDNGKWYIENTAFYYDMSYMTGLIQIDYEDYNKATIDSKTTTAINATATREIPNGWSKVDITVNDGKDDEKERYVSAKDYMFGGNGEKGFFGNDLFAIRGAELPFFGDKNCLGDTYGFGMISSFSTTDVLGNTIKQNAVMFYYDVALDLDYTIDSSLEKVYKFLTSKGFVRGKNDVFKKGNLCVRPLDNSLDLNVYVWTEEQLAAPKNVQISSGKVTWDKVANASEYAVLIDGFVVQTVKTNEYTIPYSYMDGKSHEITIVAKSKTYRASPYSDTVIYDGKIK